LVLYKGTISNKMKKTIVLIFALLSSNMLYSQKHEFKLSHSIISLMRVDQKWARSNYYDDYSFSGSFFIDYNYYLKPKLYIGTALGYEAGKKEVNIKHSYSTGLNSRVSDEYNQVDKDRYIYVAPQIGYNYINNDKFRLGSAIGLSLVFNRQITEIDDQVNEYNDVDAFFQIEVLSFTWGRTNGLTGQLGFGHKGVLSLGYFINF